MKLNVLISALRYAFLTVTAILQTVLAASVPETTLSLYDELCDEKICHGNGICFVANAAAQCLCGNFYRGKHCEYVNLAESTHQAIGGRIVFEWSQPPRLRNDYVFVYYELTPKDSNPSVVYRQKINMGDTDKAIVINSLKVGGTRYRMCVEEESVAETAVLLRAFDRLTNCVHVSTGHDFESLGGWCMVIMLSAVMVFLVYLQRDRIGLVYFYKPPVLPASTQ